MRILHLADTHLDRVFGAADDRRDPVRRRAGLRDGLSRALAAGRAEDVDAVVLAGDVYEHASVTADTVAFLAGELERAAVPVLVTPGNHDPYVAGSAWQLHAWPANVHIFAADRVEPFELADDLVVWGTAFCAATAPAGIPDGFVAPDDGRTHLLALHAALTGERWADEGRHRTVTRAQLEATGAARVLLGHFHDGYDDGFLCYPGSPEPLGWGERHGDHGVSIVAVSGASVTARHIPIAARRYVERSVSVAGTASSADIEALVSAEASREAGACLRLVLEGEVAPGCVLDVGALTERLGGGLEELVLVDRTRPAYDLEAIAREPSVRGRFVARMLGSDDPAASEAVLAGLRALDGHAEVLGAR
ncbi:MAG TPA: metallophosphoesterase [Gaiellales bacterium]|nr:metallophosphoesterase [Gaiellales bacterium]